jgi:hypothetical protein
MKTYHGYRVMQRGLNGEPVCCRCVVQVRMANGRKRELNPRLDLRSHSPTGFEWGYGGSGPAQLALALVADACGRRLAKAAIYQRVKAAIVAGLPHDGWTLSEEEIRVAVMAALSEVEGGAS